MRARRLDPGELDALLARRSAVSSQGWPACEQVGLLQKNPSGVAAPTPDPVDQMTGFELEACDLLRGDEREKVVTWGGREDISALGESLMIRVRMSRAKLFAYQV